MRKTIWKFEIPVEANYWGKFQFLLPLNSKVLSVKKQRENLCLWVEIDIKYQDKRIVRKFWKIGTGKHLPEKTNLSFIDTVIDGLYVWHFYEELDI